MSRITRATTETAVVNSIIELFTILLAPGKLSYIPVTSGKLFFEKTGKLSPSCKEKLVIFCKEQKKQYQMSESRRGFLLRIGKDSETQGILKIDEVAFPEYITHYLSLALGVAEICNLSITHVRTVRDLIDTSRVAGKAEVATEVLHNVGNVMNSINISSERINEISTQSSVRTLPDIIALLKEHEDNLGEFFTSDPRSGKIILYFEKLCEQIQEERKNLQEEISHQLQNIKLVASIISAQQTFAKESGIMEEIDFPDVLEDCLRIFEPQLSTWRIMIKKEYKKIPTVTSQRHKLLQIIVNLLDNSIEALQNTTQPDPRIILRLTSLEPAGVQLDIIDNGCGIEKANLQRIFAYGISGKKDGHGFGLHNAANLATELGGSLIASSPGTGKGSTFTLCL